MDRLCDILKTFEENYKLAETGFNHETEIAGVVMICLGLAVSPVTLRASAVLGAAGAAVATGGVARSRAWKSKKSSMEATFRQDFEAELKEFEEKLFQMTGNMKYIDKRIKEILRYINNPNHEDRYLGKYDASDNELLRLIQKYGIHGLAAKISKTVDLTVEMTGIVAQVESTNGFSDLREKNYPVTEPMNLIRFMLK